MSAISLEINYQIELAHLEANEGLQAIQGTFSQTGSSWDEGRGDVEEVSELHRALVATALREPLFAQAVDRAYRYHQEHSSLFVTTDRVIRSHQPIADACKVLWHISSYGFEPSLSPDDLAWFAILEGAAALAFSRRGRYVNTLDSNDPDRDVFKQLGILSRRAHVFAIVMQTASDTPTVQELGRKLLSDTSLAAGWHSSHEIKSRLGKLSPQAVQDVLVDPAIEKLFHAIQWESGMTVPHITSARIQPSTREEKNTFSFITSHFSSIGERCLRPISYGAREFAVPLLEKEKKLHPSVSELARSHSHFIRTLKKHLHHLLDVVGPSTQREILECLISAGELKSTEVPAQRLWLVGNTLESVAHLTLLIQQRPVAPQPLIRLSDGSIRFGDFLEIIEGLGIEVKIGGDPAGIKESIESILPAVERYQLLHLVGSYNSLNESKLSVLSMDELVHSESEDSLAPATSEILSVIKESVLLLSRYRTSDDPLFDDKVMALRQGVEAILLRRHGVNRPDEAVTRFLTIREENLLDGCQNANAVEERALLKAVLEERYDVATKILGAPLADWHFPRGLYYDRNEDKFKPKTELIPIDAINLLRELHAQKLVQIIQNGKKSRGEITIDQAAKQIQKFLGNVESIDVNSLQKREEVQTFVSSLLIGVADAYCFCNGERLVDAVTQTSRSPSEVLIRTVEVLQSYLSHMSQSLFGRGQETSLREELDDLIRWTHFIRSHIDVPRASKETTVFRLENGYNPPLTQFVDWLNRNSVGEVSHHLKTLRTKLAGQVQFLAREIKYSLKRVFVEKRQPYVPENYIFSHTNSRHSESLKTARRNNGFKKDETLTQALEKAEILLDHKRELVAWGLQTFSLVSDFAKIQQSSVSELARIVIFFETAGVAVNLRGVDPTSSSNRALFPFWSSSGNLLSQTYWDSYFEMARAGTIDKQIKCLSDADIFLQGLLVFEECVIQATCDLDKINLPALANHDVQSWLELGDRLRGDANLYSEDERVDSIADAVAKHFGSENPEFQDLGRFLIKTMGG